MSAVSAALNEYCLPGDPTPHYQTQYDGNQAVPLPSGAIQCSQVTPAPVAQKLAIHTLPQVGANADILLALALSVVVAWVEWRKGKRAED